MAATQIL